MQVNAETSALEWSEEHALLLSSASDLLTRRCDFAAVRRTAASELGFDPTLRLELSGLGWLGLCVPAELGGAGMPLSALPCLFEPMGKQLLAGPYLASTLAAQALLRAGNAGQQRALLPALATGSALASVALHEPDGFFDLDLIAAEAEHTADGFVLSGVKAAVLDAHVADHVLIAARLRGELALFAAPATALLGRLQNERLIDEGRRSARIDLSGLTLDRESLLDGADARSAIQHVQRVAWLLLASEMAGGCEGVLQLTLEYLRTRTQFGKPIGSYQALKHPMVDIMCALEEGRSLLYRAASALSQDEPGAEVALRMAKAQLGETYTFAADRSIQFHGAIGFTYDCNAQLFFKRAQWAEHSFGDGLHHRRRLADLLWPLG